MKVLVGLGNPGIDYLKTRHNVGFMFLDHLADAWGFEAFKDSRFKGWVSEGNRNGERILLLKPSTYMNLSGESVVALANFYKLDSGNDLFVIFDDMSMEFGKIRFRSEGSAGGHNGMRSLIRVFGSERFPRLKIGIGYDARFEASDWVLSRFSQAELHSLEHEVFPKALEMLEAKIIP